jgi:hypothetical protein
MMVVIEPQWPHQPEPKRKKPGPKKRPKMGKGWVARANKKTNAQLPKLEGGVRYSDIRRSDLDAIARCFGIRPDQDFVDWALDMAKRHG